MRAAASLMVLAGFVWGCDRGGTEGQALAGPTERPNILFVVWDTVRSDRLSLYGHGRPTTPHIDRWAKQARVFENCVSAGSNTVPGHASMFTGLLPTEHGATNTSLWLADELETLAELLKAAGYGTYMFSENPHICRETNLAQGFDVVEHPWSPQYRREAIQITLRKVTPNDRTSQLARKIRSTRGGNPWNIKACGELAQKGLERWLPQQDPDRPFFILVNYMEAHRPLIPSVEYRRRMMSPDQVQASYNIDRRWITLWSYVFGLYDYSPRDLELTRATYDAALLELDDLFHKLLESLRPGGYLDNTVVVLASDHGEHLGEHHLLDHQFSVYEPVLRIPLVIHYPPRVAAGRDARPVSNMDLYPTLLELAGIDPPVKSKAVSLLRPLEERVLMGEYPAVMTGAHKAVLERFPTFDPTPWNRTLRAYYDPPYKFIEASDRRHALYDLERDPGEQRNLFEARPRIVERLAGDLREYLGSLRPAPGRPSAQTSPLSDELDRRLRALGYTGGSDDADETGEDDRPDKPASRPAPANPTTQPRTP
jgi:arylsulfatase A-like enzyme